MSNRNLSGEQFFHVSKHTFQPGDHVVPRRELGIELSNEGGSGDADHVYMHDDIHVATNGWGHILSQHADAPVHVYEVEPHGPTERTVPFHDGYDEDDNYEIIAKRATVKRKLGSRWPDGSVSGNELPWNGWGERRA